MKDGKWRNEERRRKQAGGKGGSLARVYFANRYPQELCKTIDCVRMIAYE
jgi:hypothetical protein